MTSKVAIGKVRTSFGVKGELKVLSFSGEWDHFFKLKSIELRHKGSEKTFHVEYFDLRGDTAVLKLKNVDSLEEAKLLADREIWVDSDQGAVLNPGEYYLRDLIGCRLVASGEVLGEVMGFLEGGAAALLEVQKTDGKKVIVPFQEVYIGEVRIQDRVLELKTPWILE